MTDDFAVYGQGNALWAEETASGRTPKPSFTIAQLLLSWLERLAMASLMPLPSITDNLFEVCVLRIPTENCLSFVATAD